MKIWLLSVKSRKVTFWNTNWPLVFKLGGVALCCSCAFASDFNSIQFSLPLSTLPSVSATAWADMFCPSWSLSGWKCEILFKSLPQKVNMLEMQQLCPFQLWAFGFQPNTELAKNVKYLPRCKPLGKAGREMARNMCTCACKMCATWDSSFVPVTSDKRRVSRFNTCDQHIVKLSGLLFWPQLSANDLCWFLYTEVCVDIRWKSWRESIPFFCRFFFLQHFHLCTHIVLSTQHSDIQVYIIFLFIVVFVVVFNDGQNHHSDACSQKVSFCAHVLFLLSAFSRCAHKTTFSTFDSHSKLSCNRIFKDCVLCIQQNICCAENALRLESAERTGEASGFVFGWVPLAAVLPRTVVPRERLLGPGRPDDDRQTTDPRRTAGEFHPSEFVKRWNEILVKLVKFLLNCSWMNWTWQVFASTLSERNYILQTLVDDFVTENGSPLSLPVSHLVCKTGNKFFNIPLKPAR